MLLKKVFAVALVATAAFSAVPIQCNLNALNPVERKHHAALSEKLRKAAIGKQELADGLVFLLSPKTISLAELADWVDAERRCCPFLDFRLTLEHEDGAIQLALTGGPGVKELLVAEFAKIGGAIQ